jgi:V8-like Glu-specific endopeptidase
MAGITSRTKGFLGDTLRAAFAVAVLACLTNAPGMEPVALATEEADIIEQPANMASLMPSWFFERRIVGENNLEKIEAAKTSKYYNMTRPIAIVKDTTGQGFCTGWRVAEDLFVTNYHCWEFGACNVVFELDYETALSGDKHAKFRCEEVLARNELYDYALYHVSRVTDDDVRDDGKNGGKNAGEMEVYSADTATGKGSRLLAQEGGVITMWGGNIEVGQMLIVAGHPQARTKEIDRSKHCKLSSVEPEEMGGRMTIRHTCDTEGGSSGSPVLDRNTGHAVALHWGGEDGFNMSIPMNLVLDDMEKAVDAKTFRKLTIAGRK